MTLPSRRNAKKTSPSRHMAVAALASADHLDHLASPVAMVPMAWTDKLVNSVLPESKHHPDPTRRHSSPHSAHAKPQLERPDQMAQPDPKDHLEMLEHPERMESPATKDPEALTATKVHLVSQDAPDHPASPERPRPRPVPQADPVPLDAPEHLDLQAHLAVTAKTAMVEHLARLDSQDPPAHLAATVNPDQPASLESQDLPEAATTAHLRVSPQATKLFIWCWLSHLHTPTTFRRSFTAPYFQVSSRILQGYKYNITSSFKLSFLVLLVLCYK